MERNWSENELIEFIVEASQHTYANPSAERLKEPYRPNCDEYLYERGDWRYHDSYAWSKDGGGGEIVYYQNQPVWVMNYYGFLVGEQDAKRLYGFLHQALGMRHPMLPVRGDALSADGLRYEVAFERGEIGNFVGRERIYADESLAYECYVHGGFVR